MIPRDRVRVQLPEVGAQHFFCFADLSRPNLKHGHKKASNPRELQRSKRADFEQSAHGILSDVGHCSKEDAIHYNIKQTQTALLHDYLS